MELTITDKTIRTMEKSNPGIIRWPLIIFLILNTLKISFFNMFIMNHNTIELFIYKSSITFLVTVIIYILLTGLRTRIPFVVLYILQDIYIFINIIYYAYFHSYLHIFQAFALFNEGVGAAGDLSILMSPKMLIILLDMPAAIYMAFAHKSLGEYIKRIRWTKRISVVLTCLLAICIVIYWNNTHGYSISSLTKANSNASESLIVQRYGTLANGVSDMIMNKNDKNLIRQLKYGQHITGKRVSSGKPNIVVIQVESMDANAVNKQHNGQYVMPFLHSLAQQNVYYPYMMSYHKAGGTSDCEFSTMNSVEPLGDYPSMDIKNYNYQNSIVRQLVNNSYSTIAFHGNVGSYFNRDIAYPKMGYQELYDLTKMGLKEYGWGAPDSDMFNYEENKLKDIKQPFFTYSITMSSHGPFTNAENYYNNRNYDDVHDKTTRNYMNSMSYVDQSLKSFVDYIRTNYKNTYIFIWGDHTPNVKNDEYMQSSFTDNDKYFEFVPLIIVTPGSKVYKEDRIAASFLDIAPTIAKASGISYNINSDGMDLLNRTGEYNKIPYRDGSFDRSDLYNKVSLIK